MSLDLIVIIVSFLVVTYYAVDTYDMYVWDLESTPPPIRHMEILINTHANEYFKMPRTNDFIRVCMNVRPVPKMRFKKCKEKAPEKKLKIGRECQISR